MPKAEANTIELTLGHGFEGRSLGKFRVLREIACGGMATIYLARRAEFSGLGQEAAVKVIHPHLAKDREFVDMFLDEARIVTCINHPNVCRVLDFGKAEGTYYLAMEYVMGETWSEVLAALKRSPEGQAMIPALITRVMVQACEGMHAAHEARDPEDEPLSIVHRDVSPQNLMVGYDGSVRVLDFGIASAADRLHTTRNGTIKGRFAYMAPEQMRGTPVDRRADVWSLGVVLWEGLAQRRLFKRDTEAETVLAVTHDPLPALAPSLPAPLVSVVQKALERDREARFASAREFGVALASLPSTAIPAVTMADLAQWMQRLFAERIARKREFLREAARASEAELRVGTSFPPVPNGIANFAARPHAANQQVAPSFSAVRGVTHEHDLHGAPKNPFLDDAPESQSLEKPDKASATLGLLVFAVLAVVTFVLLRQMKKEVPPPATPAVLSD